VTPEWTALIICDTPILAASLRACPCRLRDHLLDYMSARNGVRRHGGLAIKEPPVYRRIS